MLLQHPPQLGIDMETPSHDDETNQDGKPPMKILTRNQVNILDLLWGTFSKTRLDIIPAHFFKFIGVALLRWECQDFS